MLNYSPARLLDLAHAVVLDLDGRILLWTGGTGRMYGWTSAEAVGQVAHELLKTQFPVPLEEVRARLLREGEWQGELAHTRRDGNQIVVASHWVLLRDTQGAPAAIFEVNNDITGVKRAEEVLRESRAQLENLIGSAMDAIITVDESQRVVLFNAAAAKMFRCPAPEALGQPIDRFVPGRFRRTHRQHIQAFGETNVTSRSMGALGSISGLRADGEEFRIEASISQAEVGGRKLFTVILRDVTERTRAEDALRESEGRYQALVELSPDAIVVHCEGRVTFINSSGVKLLHAPGPEAVIGREILGFVHPDFHDSVRERLKRLREGGKADPEEMRFVRLDGSEVYGEIVSVPLTFQGRPAAQAVIRDITERKRAEAERERLLSLEQQARTKAEEANRLKDEFLAVLSHELRTPLTPIIGWTAMLRAGQLDGTHLDGALEAIERSAKSQSRLIDDLLDVSRIASGKLQLDLRPVHIAPMIEAAVAAVRPSAEAKSLRLETEIDPRAGFVSGDPERLQQVVLNLLTNAVKFTPHGGRVRVRLARDGPYAEIAVSDTGIGIRTEFLPHVFDRFRQADASTTRRHGGLGLGLSIVRDLVEMHGGTIRVESPGEGRGATFTFKLPGMTAQVGYGDVERRRASVEGDAGRHAPPSLGGLRVLAVDDEPNTRELLAAVLRQYGAEAKVVASAGEALGALGSWRPDVMVADIEMPDEDGYSLISKVRALPEEEGGRTPAIALTAYARAEDRVRSLLAGYQVHLPKPVAPGELAAVVAGLAGRLPQ